MADCDRDFIINELKKIKNIEFYQIYEFGIYTGYSFKYIYDRLEKFNILPNFIWGFDSFEGLPKEKEGLPISPGWEEGYFRIDDKNIMQTIEKSVSGAIPFELVKGYFEDTLNENLLKKLKPAIYLDLDVDLYISTYQVLDFFFKNKLIAQGCYIGYDDYGGVKDLGGESLAHKEIMYKYNVSFIELASFGDGNPHMQKVFQILNY